jgi:hypothetical protein
MAFRPNYTQQRGERNRTKEQKKQEKLQRREEDAAKRRAARGQLQRTESGVTSLENPSEKADGPQDTTR